MKARENKIINSVNLTNLSGQRASFNIKKSAVKVLNLLNIKRSSVDIFLMKSGQMRFLNNKFLHKNDAADVLSFSEPDNFPYPESKFKPLGEIYINAGYLKNPALFSYLLIHGFLHLSGYDHKKKSDTIKMGIKEQRLFKILS